MRKNEFWPYNAENIHQGFSIDCVIISFHKGKLRVLLSKFNLRNYWSLLGGFMFNEEAADEAAYRILKARTGLTDVFLKQFYLFSNPKRVVMQQNLDFVKKNATEKNEGEWLLRRFISLGFYALVRYDQVKLYKVEDELLKWYDINDLPDLYSDHEHIVKTALETIRTLLPLIPIGCELLPNQFTMTELRKIYEGILGKTLDRRNFQRKMLSEGYVVPLGEKKESQAYNAPILYTFDLKARDQFFSREF